MSEFGFTLAPSVFESLPTPADPRFSATLRDKGVLMAFNAPGLPSQQPGPPEIALHFLATDLNMQHGELLHRSDYLYTYDTMPVFAMVNPRRPLFFALRYTAWKNRQSPLEMGLMLDTGMGDVATHKYYGELRRTVAVACAQAILGTGEGATGDGPVRLKVANNFSRPGRLRPLPDIGANNIGHLYKLLSAAS